MSIATLSRDPLVDNAHPMELAMPVFPISFSAARFSQGDSNRRESLQNLFISGYKFGAEVNSNRDEFTVISRTITVLHQTQPA